MDAEVLRKDVEEGRSKGYPEPILTDAVQHHAVPHLLSQSELPVELQLDGVVCPHLVDRENYVITPSPSSSLSSSSGQTGRHTGRWQTERQTVLRDTQTEK